MSLLNWPILIIVFACAGACYFSACGVALKTFSRSRLADLLESAGRPGRLERINGRLPRLQLITGVLRTALSLVVLLAVLHLVDTGFAAWEPMQVYAASFGIAGALVTLFAVAIPASWARYRRERLLAWSLPLLDVLARVLMPVAVVLELADPLIRRISGAAAPGESDSDIGDQVLTAVEDLEGGAAVDQEQKEMLEGVFDLAETDVGEVMTPRTEVCGIAIDSTLEQVREAIITFGHSRIPVYKGSLDHIVGILYAKDLIAFLGNGRSFDLERVLREPYPVPESKRVRDLLQEFRARKVHLAIVVDEYGGTAGLVTIEDVLEEIVGEIQDEYEPGEQPPQIRPLEADAADVDARVRVDDLGDHFDVELPENEDYDTVGGFVVTTLGHIPSIGESFEFAGLRFTVTGAERTRVRLVKVERLSQVPSPE